MWKIISFVLLMGLIYGPLQMQAQWVSGPVTGAVTHREARVALTVEGQSEVRLAYGPDSIPEKNWTRVVPAKTWISGKYRRLQFVLTDLDPGTSYRYRLYSGGKILHPSVYSFQTPELWEWRKPAPDFTFLTGSCLYINESQYDRPGTPYGKSTDIIRLMAQMPKNFMLWLGDNTYYREVDYSSPSAMFRRFMHTQSDSAVQSLLHSSPQYAIWDDHDFGPNDSDRNFDFAAESLEWFRAFWPNPYSGTAAAPGAYCSFRYSDAEFFLLDNRTFRAPDKMPADHPDKDYWGPEQLQWLKEKLLTSKAVFKIIVNGNQVLNPNAPGNTMETLEIYPKEKKELMEWLSNQNISGVIFISGDRHFTELIKLERPGKYPLSDYTCSPLTSGAFEKIRETVEGNNPLRVPGSLFTAQNFGRISVKGEKNERVLTIETLDASGRVQFTWSCHQKDLK